MKETTAKQMTAEAIEARVITPCVSRTLNDTKLTFGQTPFIIPISDLAPIIPAMAVPCPTVSVSGERSLAVSPSFGSKKLALKVVLILFVNS